MRDKNLTETLNGLTNIMNSDELRNLPIDWIYQSKNQDRKFFSEKKLDELTNSIKEIGIRVPLEVKEILPDQQYEIIAGERRYRAAKKAGVDTVPAIIRKNTNETLIRESQFAENMHREDLNAVEKALAITQLIKLESYSQKKVAEICGKSEPWVSKQLKILDQPEEIQELARQGIIKDLNTLYEISSLPQKERQEIISLAQNDKDFSYKNHKKNSRTSVSTKDENKEEFKLSDVEIKKLIALCGFDKKINQKHPNWHKDLTTVFNEFKKWINK